MIAPAGHHWTTETAPFRAFERDLRGQRPGKDMGSMAQTGLLLVPSDALGHTWALPGALGGGQGLPPQTGPKDLKKKSELSRNVATVGTPIRTRSTTVYGTGAHRCTKKEVAATRRPRRPRRPASRLFISPKAITLFRSDITYMSKRAPPATSQPPGASQHGRTAASSSTLAAAVCLLQVDG